MASAERAKSLKMILKYADQEWRQSRDDQSGFPVAVVKDGATLVYDI